MLLEPPSGRSTCRRAWANLGRRSENSKSDDTLGSFKWVGYKTLRIALVKDRGLLEVAS